MKLGINKISVPNLCDSEGVSLDSVTKILCVNTPNVCEVYMKKGTVNGVNVQSCTHYCAAYRLGCVEMYDDQNNCNRGTKYTTCDETGGGTSDHICVCRKKQGGTCITVLPINYFSFCYFLYYDNLHI